VNLFNSATQSMTLDKIRKSIGISAGLGLLLILGGAGIAVQASMTAKATEANLESLQAEIRSIDGQLERAKKLTSRSESTRGENGLAAVQRFLKQSSRATGVELLEVQTGTSPMPFLTRYAKNGDDNGKIQTDLQVNLRGDIRKIYALLVSLRNCPTGFEIDAIDITRAEGSKAKSAPVTAKLNMRIVTQEGS
jgi:hypothetical protein